MCAKFIQKFESIEEYNDNEHQYPNISLVEGEGLIWEAEEPEQEPNVLLNGSKIKWNVTDGVNRTSVDYPSISFADAQTLINALNDPKNYTVTATGSYNDGGKNNFTDVQCSFENITEQEAEIFIENEGIKIVTLNLFSNTKSPAPVYNAVTVNVERSDQPTATWEINYTIENAR